MKYFFISGFCHSLLLLGVLSFQSQSESTPLNTNPIQFVVINDEIEIVSKPQRLKALRESIRTNGKSSKSPSKKEVTTAQSKAPELSQNNKYGKNIESSQSTGIKKSALKASYAQALFLYLSQNKHYPRKARKLNHTGTVTIKIHVTSNGLFQHIHLEKGCNHSTLNEAALHLIQKLGKFKPLPKRLGSGADFTVPLKYTISRGSQ